jgi:AmmeMemoRadiSam system protein B
VATNIRPAAVCGSWYPASAERLGREVDAYVAAAGTADVPAPRAIVVPHAGLRYSGPVAACAYHASRDACYSSIVLVGPSHFVGFNGVSIWPHGAWQTPFGPVQVNEELTRAIAAQSQDVVENREAHAREHSLEMQLPFIAHLLPGVPIVPMVMGYQSRQTAFGLGEAIASAIMQGRSGSSDPLLVASSDLSHFEDARIAEKMDKVVLDRVAGLDPGGLMDALEREPHHACGGGPIVAVLHAARQLGVTHARVLRYADSGDVSGDKSSVVGYMAAAMW